MKVKLKPDNGKEPFETLPPGTIVEVEGGSLWMKVQDTYNEQSTYVESNNRRAVLIGPVSAGLGGVIKGKDYKRVVQGTFVED